MHLKYLELKASKIWLHIPSGVTWEDVSLEASDVLSIAFKDVARFVRVVRLFQISYMYASGSFLVDLGCEVGRQGLHRKATQCHGRTTLCFSVAKGNTFKPCSIRTSWDH